MKFQISYTFIFTLFCTLISAQEIGPKKGSLVIAGGAATDPAIFQRFIDLAGGPDANIVIIPTASGASDFGPAYRSRAFKAFQALGASNLSLFHTYDRSQADSDIFIEPLTKATGVWFSGGRQWRLVDAYLGTKAEIAFNHVLEKGGVIGGSSAGASIQGSFLVRGDTNSNTVMMGDHIIGFGYLKNTAIYQHLLKRNRQFDLIEVIEAHPELLGIGLDENTAIIVTGDRFEVIGQSMVAIYDPAMIVETGRFYLLNSGDRFDLLNKEAFRPSRRYNKLEIPESFKKIEN